MSAYRRRVVVTGIGPVTSLGTGVEPVWKALVDGRSGIDFIRSFDPSDSPVKIAGEVGDFVPEVWMSPKDARHTDRMVHLAMAAAKLAWRDAGEPHVESHRAGVYYSSAIGGILTLLAQHLVFLERGPSRISPFMVPSMMPNAAAGQVAMALGFSGPNACIATACASSGHAIGEAYRTIQLGVAEVCIAGGADATLHPIFLAAFAQMQAISRNPDPVKASRPFDRERDGFVMSEGACALVLEEAARAKARGARIYAEVVGYGASADAYHITAPDPEGVGAIHAVQACLHDAGEPPEAIDYINAHGTSTKLNDAAETLVIKKILGDRAYEVPVSATKSMTGHLLGASGALEAGITALVVRDGVIPPTINYEHPDQECDLDYVPNESRMADVRFAISNSFGFGGHNSVLGLRRWESGSGPGSAGARP